MQKFERGFLVIFYYHLAFVRHFFTQLTQATHISMLGFVVLLRGSKCDTCVRDENI